jgi:hypothetical protein
MTSTESSYDPAESKDDEDQSGKRNMAEIDSNVRKTLFCYKILLILTL